MNKGLSYDQFYTILLNLREEFHRTGRFDDSNSKLNEIIKIIVLSFSLAKDKKRFSLEFVRNIAKEVYGDEYSTARALDYLFRNEIVKQMFLNDDGSNLFGNDNKLNIPMDDNSFADILVMEISKIDFLNLMESNDENDFDLVNECFGHFIRDNFRNNKEDGQYMTPSEVSKHVCKVLADIVVKDKKILERIKNNDFKMLDPTCGVGTLIIEAYKSIVKALKDNEVFKSFDFEKNIKKNGLYGQDKVDRMVKLSKINMMLMNANFSNINVGNSIIGDSFLDTIAGDVDIIISNPPFGADFEIDELEQNKYPFINSVRTKYKTIKSELAIFDKSLKMLRPDGYLVIVVPDSIVSAKGIASEFRDYLIKEYNLKWIFDLPAVTFAQAGTRTNTSIIILKKEKVEYISPVMFTCESIGYDVKERMGVPVKINQGINELEIIEELLKNDNSSSKVLSESPSVVRINKEDLVSNILKPSFYNAKQFDKLKNENMKKLRDYVEIGFGIRKSYYTSKDIKHISVLHVDDDGVINFKEVENFEPISKGREVFPGDILISKLNPRISRVTIVPETKYKLVCSNEFEILTPLDSKLSILLCYILKSSMVYEQIITLTSGTSSSHSRIKREQLLEIKLPELYELMKDKNIEKECIKVEESLKKIYSSKNIIDNFINLINASRK